MRVSLIIPAAGCGSRFRKSLGSYRQKKPGPRSKLAYEINGEPLLYRTIRAFAGLPQVRETLVAVSPEMRRAVGRWPLQFQGLKVSWVPGGRTRAVSVLRALKRTSARSEWIMVHDGARPLISRDSIRKVLRAAAGWDGVILARKVIPTIKKVLTQGRRIMETVDREALYEAETPQLVRRNVLLKAYRDASKVAGVTDEAGLLERIGARVRVVPHGDWNPKVTSLQDLLLAQAMTQKTGAPEVRVGLGFDTHRLVAGRKFYLGGIVIPSSKGTLGHSDGDPLLHALADAMLGAIGAGDIGEWFSDRDRRYKNVRSTIILKKVLGEVKRQGWVPYQVDTNIILERPKLYGFKDRIRRNVARCLGLCEKDVSIKARTREGLGPEGEGLAVTCEAVVSMKKAVS